MTILIFRDGVMAADTAAFRGSFIVSTEVRKIIRTPEGALVACAGLAADIDRFNAWAMAGFNETIKPEPPPKAEKDDEGAQFGAIVALPDGRVLQFHEDFASSDCTAEPWLIDGAANEFMHALATTGMSAEDIIAHTIKHCVWAGGEVFSMRLDEVEPGVERVDSGDELGIGNGGWVDKPPDAGIDTFLRDRGLE